MCRQTPLGAGDTPALGFLSYSPVGTEARCHSAASVHRRAATETQAAPSPASMRSGGRAGTGTERQGGPHPSRVYVSPWVKGSHVIGPSNANKMGDLRGESSPYSPKPPHRKLPPPIKRELCFVIDKVCFFFIKLNVTVLPHALHLNGYSQNWQLFSRAGRRNNSELRAPK